MVRFFGVLAVVVAAVACTKKTAAPPPPTTTTVVTGPVTLQVTGVVNSLTATRAVSDPIAPPFTITVAARGVGGGEFDHVQVDGKPSQINWQAGQPLPVRGDGAGFNLNGAALRVDDAGIVWSLDGEGREILPGTYTLGSSVAVGTGGIATPVDSATFTATADSLLSTRGDARLTYGPRRLRIEGSEGALTLHGAFTLTDASGTRTVESLTVGPGAYRLTLTPAARAYTVDGEVQGTVKT